MATDFGVGHWNRRYLSTRQYFEMTMRDDVEVSSEAASKMSVSRLGYC